jgi:hypothetical protein
MGPLTRGDAVPHVTIDTPHGRFNYDDIWQRRSLVLVVLSATAQDDRYANALDARRTDFQALESVCVTTRNAIDGLPPASLLIADKWGEIVYVTTGRSPGELPPPEEVLDWLQWVAHRCPECEGEAR